MKILIYSVYFSPDLTGNGKYVGEMASWLASQGHSVRVITAPPYYPKWELPSQYKAPIYRREEWQGVRVWRAPLWVPAKPGGAARLLHLLTFAMTSLPVMLRQILWRPDIVLTVTPSIFCAPTGWVTSRLSGATAWIHLQDLEVDVAFELGLLKGNLLQKVVLGVERWLLRRFDKVSTISRRMFERLSNKGVDRSRLSLFPNWVDLTKITPGGGTGEFRSELGISADAIVVLFSGTLGAKQGLQVIPAAARLLAQRQDIVFVICGDGPMKPEVEMAKKSLPNLRTLPLQPINRLGELLATADIHLLPQSPGAADLVLPSKLSGMLASGRPIIATCSSGTELHWVVSQCGVSVPPEDDIGLAGAIVRLADDEAERRILGKRARAWAEANIDRDSVLSNAFRFDDNGSLDEPLTSISAED